MCSHRELEWLILELPLGRLTVTVEFWMLPSFCGGLWLSGLLNSHSVQQDLFRLHWAPYRSPNVRFIHVSGTTFVSPKQPEDGACSTMHPLPLGLAAAGDASLQRGVYTLEHGNYTSEVGLRVLAMVKRQDGSCSRMPNLSWVPLRLLAAMGVT